MSKQQSTSKRLLSRSMSHASQILENSQKRFLKPLGNKEFKELIMKHSDLVKKETSSLQGKVRFINNEKSYKKAFKDDQQSSNPQVTVSDLSKDFMQIVNLPRKGEDSDQEDNKYLLCDIDPKSSLFQPIEALRKILLKESDNEEDYLSGSDDNNSISIQDRERLSRMRERQQNKKKERNSLEMYLDSVENEYKKKFQSQVFSMDIIKELHEFYQSCFSQFIMKLAPVNFELKKVANRLSCGMDLLNQSLVRHHCKEVQEYRQIIENLKEENSRVKQAYKYLRNDIQRINRMVPQVSQLIEKTQLYNQDMSFKKEVNLREMEATEKERYLSQVMENEENLQALTQIESLIEIRNAHNYKKKETVEEFSINRFNPSMAEKSLKNILADIKDHQFKNSNEIRANAIYEKDEEDIENDMKKQVKIIEKDWTGERNQKISDVHRKLVDKMMIKLNKPKQREVGIVTEAKIVSEEDHQRILNLNNEYHRQLANNGVVFSLKEKQIDEIQAKFLKADLDLKRSDRQLNDIKVINQVKKNFIQQIKSEYETILMNILSVCVKYATDILEQNQLLKKESKLRKKHKNSDEFADILNEQKISTENYLLGINESKMYMDDVIQKQLKINTKRLKEQEKAEKEKEKQSQSSSQNMNKSQQNNANNQKNAAVIKNQSNQQNGQLKSNPSTFKNSVQTSKQNSDSDTSNGSSSSEDSVDQVLNSGFEYNDEHLEKFEQAKLKQRYSIGPQILKKQIFRLGEQMKESRTSSMRSSRNNQTSPTLSQRRKSNDDHQMHVIRQNLKVQVMQTENAQDSPPNSKDEALQKIEIKKKRTIKGNLDDHSVKLEAIQAELRKADILGSQHNQSKDKNQSPDKRGLDVINEIYDDEEDNESIKKMPKKFAQFMKHQGGGQNKNGTNGINANNKIGGRKSRELSEEERLRKSSALRNSSLEKIKEEYGEDSQDGDNQRSGRKSQGGSQSRGARRGQAVKQRGTAYPTDMIAIETQTDLNLDDYFAKMNSALVYLNQITDSSMDFKTEVQNLSMATRMMSEAKINQIRQIFKHIVVKAQSDQVTVKPLTVASNQNVQTKVGQNLQGEMIRKGAIGSRGQEQRQSSNEEIKRIQGSQQQVTTNNQGNNKNNAIQNSNTKINPQNFKSVQNNQRATASREKTQKDTAQYQQPASQQQSQNIDQKYGQNSTQQFQNQPQQNETIQYPNNIKNNQQQKSITIKSKDPQQSLVMQQDIDNWQGESISRQQQQQQYLINQQQLTNIIHDKEQLNPTQFNIIRQQMLSQLKDSQSQEMTEPQLKSQRGNTPTKYLYRKLETQSHSSLPNQYLYNNQSNVTPAIVSVQSFQKQLQDGNRIDLMNQTTGSRNNQFEGMNENMTIENGIGEQSPSVFMKSVYKNGEQSNGNFQIESTYTHTYPEKIQQINDSNSQQIPQSQSYLSSKDIQQSLPSSIQQLLEQSTSEAQKFFYINMIKEQQDKLKEKKGQGGQLSKIVNPLTSFRESDPNERRRKGRRKPKLDPIQAVKLQTLADSQQQSDSNQTISMTQSKSMPSLPKILPSSQVNLSNLNTSQLLSMFQDTSMFQSINNNSTLLQDPSLTDRYFEQIKIDQNSRSQQRSRIYKDIIQNHVDLKKQRQEKEDLKYRDRKKSITDQEKQGIEAQSYSNQGKRYDYLPFNL